MKNLKKKDFMWIWKDSTKESILNQFYYEHMQLQKLLELCDKYEEEHNTTFQEWQKDIQANKKAIEYINNGYLSDGEMVNILAQQDLLNILQGEDNE